MASTKTDGTNASSKLTSQSDQLGGGRSVGARTLYDVYKASLPTYSGQVTVPVLWDKETSAIVSNELSEIIRMMNSAFGALGAREGDYYPEDLRQRSTRSTTRFTSASITAFIELASPPPKPPTKKQSIRYSKRWIDSKSSWAVEDFYVARE